MWFRSKPCDGIGVFDKVSIGDKFFTKNSLEKFEKKTDWRFLYWKKKV